MNKGIVYIIGGIVVVVLVALHSFFALRRNRLLKKGARKTDVRLAGKLRDEQLKSDFILNAIEDGVVLIDRQKIIRLFNPAASKITGWENKEAVGLDYRLVFKLVSSKGVAYEAASDPFSLIFKDEKPRRDNSAALVLRSQKNIAISLSVSPLLDQDRHLSAVVGVFQDISQEKREEQQRAEFISTASHEMRTPVAAIEGYLSLALNDKVSTIDSRARNYLERAHFSTQSLGRLFQDLLTSARAEDGRLSSHPVVIEMSSFLSRLTDDLKFSSQKQNITTNFVLGSSKNIAPGKGPGTVVPPLYYVHADPERVREVITNLFENAIKYTKQGTITIGLTGNDELVQFYVRDTGRGIPPEDIPHLFQKFYRVDNTATRTINGTGLGLFICRKIVSLYGGQIWVESTLGVGSTFFINLPRLSSQRANQLKEDE